MGYIFLVFTILSESFAVVCMKLSDGFQNKWFTVLAVISYALSFIFLTITLKHLPAGFANAIWAGTSAVLVALIGMFFFHEKFSVWQLVSLLLIVIGLVGINILKVADK